jgi:formyltetrahydrofolate synthetase
MSLLATRARVKAVAAGDTGKAMAIINDAVVKLSAQCVHHSKSLTTLVEHFRKEAEHALTHADASASAITDNSAMALQSAVQMDSVRSDVQALVTELEKSAEIADKNAAEAKLAEVEILSTSSLGIKLPLTLPNDPALRNEPESKVSSNRE